MKRLAIIGTIAALAFSTAGEAKPQKEKQAKREVTATQPASKSRVTAVAPTRSRTVTSVAPTRSRAVTTRVPTRSRTFATVAPAGSRTVVRNYYGGGYYGGYYPYYSGYYPYYGGSSFSIGIGTGYPYGYGYGYPYGYGYNSYYPSGYSYGYSSYGYNVVAEVQQRLARYGYYRGSIDGEAGPLTRAAVARWEANHGMYADGRIDQQLLRSLGLS
jgi:Putative peptidoglycan binding domain